MELFNLLRQLVNWDLSASALRYRSQNFCQKLFMLLLYVHNTSPVYEIIWPNWQTTNKARVKNLLRAPRLGSVKTARIFSPASYFFSSLVTCAEVQKMTMSRTKCGNHPIYCSDFKHNCEQRGASSQSRACFHSLVREFKQHDISENFVF